VLFNACVSLLIFLSTWPISESVVLKSCNIIVLGSICVFMSSCVCFIKLSHLTFGVYRFTIAITSQWILPFIAMKRPSLFPLILVWVLLCQIMFSCVCFIKLSHLTFGAYICTIVIASQWILPFITMKRLSLFPLILVWVLFCQSWVLVFLIALGFISLQYLFPSFTLKMFLSLLVMCTSSRQ
jgi:hypothetical protein